MDLIIICRRQLLLLGQIFVGCGTPFLLGKSFVLSLMFIEYPKIFVLPYILLTLCNSYIDLYLQLKFEPFIGHLVYIFSFLA